MRRTPFGDIFVDKKTDEFRSAGPFAGIDNRPFNDRQLSTIQLEMEVQQAVAESFREKYGKESKAAPARSLPRMLRRAGLKPRRKRTYAADRQPPFDEALRRFLELHLEFLRKTAEGRLEGEQWERFLCLTDKVSPEWLLAREDVDVTCLNVLFVGERARE